MIAPSKRGSGGSCLVIEAWRDDKMMMMMMGVANLFTNYRRVKVYRTNNDLSKTLSGRLSNVGTA